MELSEWAWRLEGQKLIPVMTDESPALDVFLQMIHCNSSGGCRKHGFEYISACGHCQHGNCDNMTNEPVTEEDDEQDGI